MRQWFETNEIDDERIKFAILIAKFKDKFIVIHNKKRGGWEIPGGNREAGEEIVYTASRELFEETGAIGFALTPFGIYQWNGSFGMVFYAEVDELSTLPESEIEEIKFEDELPKDMNFGDMFYYCFDKWNQCKENNLAKYTITIKLIDHKVEIDIR
ncbi:NUDIX domain-containing protein [Cohnella sp. GCM10027633]|uniref:NUDIX domain-containing protein n=1 Tax=unclassified Cohnella TaxID=2636738 RepID=UPI0036343AD9